MLHTIETVNSAVNNFIWGVPAMICIIGVGLYLSIRTRFLQIRKFPYAIKTTIGRIFRKRDASDGAITPFQAVCTAQELLQSEVPEQSSGCGFLRFSECVQNSPK